MRKGRCDDERARRKFRCVDYIRNGWKGEKCCAVSLFYVLGEYRRMIRLLTAIAANNILNKVSISEHNLYLVMQIEDAQKKQEILTNIMRKELSHLQRMVRK